MEEDRIALAEKSLREWLAQCPLLRYRDRFNIALSHGIGREAAEKLAREVK
jgi:hypothetical protein